MTMQAQPRNGLVQLAAGANGQQGPRYIELDTGKVYDENGEFVQQMMHGDDKATEVTLADYAATYDAECISANTGRPVTLRDPSFKSGDNPEGSRIIQCRHMSDVEGLRTLASPQGDLGPADVHIARTLPGYAAGYTLADGVADIASPPFLVPFQSDKYWTWSQQNQFTLVQPLIGAAGASPNEVNLALSNTSFQVVPYVLGGFLQTELQANADAPLNVMSKLMRTIMDKLKLARELRVVTQLTTSGNWNANLVNTVPAANKWNNGVSADPLADLHLLIEQSYMDPTDIIMSALVYHWLCRSPAIQKYIYAKYNKEVQPTGDEISAYFRLPKITVANMKYLPTASGAITYAWGNHVVLLRSTAALATQQDVSTARTFRWTGGPTPDGSAVGGWLVRTYFDQKRGPRGGTAVVVSHYDQEVMTSNLVGGLNLNSYQ